MESSSLLPAVLGALVGSAPQLLVLAAALIIALTRWNTLPTAGMYVASGAGLMLMTTLISRVAFTVLPIAWRDQGVSTVDLSMRLTAASVVTGLLQAVGLGLWLAAVFAQRAPPRER